MFIKKKIQRCVVAEKDKIIKSTIYFYKGVLFLSLFSLSFYWFYPLLFTHIVKIDKNIG